MANPADATTGGGKTIDLTTATFFHAVQRDGIALAAIGGEASLEIRARPCETRGS